MKSNKEYRWEDNPKEKEFHDRFVERFKRYNSATTELSTIVFGCVNDRQAQPKQYLTSREADICLNIIQWLGSPVGQGFLSECGFELKSKRL